MALNNYLQHVQQILRDETQETYNPGDLSAYVNQARLQVAGEAQCIRAYGTLALTAATNQYSFNSVVTTSVPGTSGLYNIRQMWYQVGSGQLWITPRPFEWFGLYFLNNAAPVPGPPNTWAQFGQGLNGTVFIGPTPDTTYNLFVDCVAVPQFLAVDTDPEAIPSAWVAAIEWLAAYYALVEMPRNPAESAASAEKMYQRYLVFMANASRYSVPSVLPRIYPQARHAAMIERLGGVPAMGGNAAGGNAGG